MKYSTKEKMRAVKVYKENGSISKTVRQIGYPKCRRMLYDWVAEYDKSGTVSDKRCGRTEIASYSQEQIDKAVFFYHSYRKGIRAAVAALGYPSASTLRRWVAAAGQAEEIKDSKSGEELLQYTTAAAVAAAVEFSSGERSLDDSSGEHGLSKRQVKEAATVLLNKENDIVMRNQGQRITAIPALKI